MPIRYVKDGEGRTTVCEGDRVYIWPLQPVRIAAIDRARERILVVWDQDDRKGLHKWIKRQQIIAVDE